uniref:Uncharacterized protein n=1 Tax=Rhizophora mucronata TaxID=61149 RepID=A0A2P2K7W9_RHIMU
MRGRKGALGTIYTDDPQDSVKALVRNNVASRRADVQTPPTMRDKSAHPLYQWDFYGIQVLQNF